MSSQGPEELPSSLSQASYAAAAGRENPPVVLSVLAVTCMPTLLNQPAGAAHSWQVVVESEMFCQVLQQYGVDGYLLLRTEIHLRKGPRVMNQ